MCWICGISFYSKDILEKISIPLSARKKQTSHKYYSEHLSLYHASLRLTDVDLAIRQPIEYDTLIISFVWEIYNREYLASNFLDWSSKRYTEWELIAELFFQLWIDFANYINGEFLIYIYDTSCDTHYFFRDRYGSRALYYFVYRNNIYFASEIKSLYKICESHQINRNALFEYMTCWFSHSPNTIFKGISIIPPAHVLSFSNGDIALKAFTTFHNQEKNKNFLEAFEKSVIRRIPREHNKIFLSLSWWLDSNLILYFLQKHFTWKIIAYSFLNTHNSDDIYCAQKNAKLYNIEHHIFRVTENLISDHYVHEGLVSLCNFSKILREALPQYDDVHIEFSWDGREEVFETNSHFDLDTIQKWILKFGLDASTRNKSFLNTSMLDFNLQLIEKITLNNLIERRLPFLDYEIIKFKHTKSYNDEIRSFLMQKWFTIVSHTYGHNQAINFKYPKTKEEITLYLNSFLKSLI